MFSSFCQTYRSTVHDQSHLSGLVDVAPEGDAWPHAAMAAVVRSAAESCPTQERSFQVISPGTKSINSEDTLQIWEFTNISTYFISKLRG